MSHEVVLISHPNVTWLGARNLRTAAEGFLLAITRNPLRDGATRLIEEGYDPASVLVIRDSNDDVPEIRTTIKDASK